MEGSVSSWWVGSVSFFVTAEILSLSWSLWWLSGVAVFSAAAAVSSSPSEDSFAVGIQNASLPPSTNVAAAKFKMSSNMAVKLYGFFGGM